MSAPPPKKRMKHLVRYAHWSLEECYIRKINAALIHARRFSYSQQLVSFCPKAGNEETSRLCREREGETEPDPEPCNDTWAHEITDHWTGCLYSQTAPQTVKLQRNKLKIKCYISLTSFSQFVPVPD